MLINRDSYCYPQPDDIPHTNQHVFDFPWKYSRQNSYMFIGHIMCALWWLNTSGNVTNILVKASNENTLQRHQLKVNRPWNTYTVFKDIIQRYLITCEIDLYNIKSSYWPFRWWLRLLTKCYHHDTGKVITWILMLSYNVIYTVIRLNSVSVYLQCDIHRLG